MGMTHREFLSSSRIFGCKVCRTHLATIDSLMSRNFNGQSGRAFLFDSVVNIQLGEPEDRHMTTGLHTDRAFVTSEKYKEGKFILERSLLDDVE